MSDKVVRLEAELALAKAEADFVAKKKAGKLTSEDRHNLHAVRKAFRENHRQAKPGATPATIGTEGKTK